MLAGTPERTVWYAYPCRCRPDYNQAVKRIGELADQRRIDVKRPPAHVPGERELSVEQARGLFDEVQRILRRPDDI
ncbi:MAG TPA: hypothetical protein VLL25_17375 [Acidimicrobiales bacterium]|nr:hypothetical protein [Acidimicrobiales bacterium]